MIRETITLGSISRALLIGFASFALTGCQVAESTLVVGSLNNEQLAFTAAPVSPILCRSKLGSYALPRGYLKVEVKKAGDQEPSLTLSHFRRADQTLTFCLDHLSDPLADDEVRIIKASGQAGAKKGYAEPAGDKPSESGYGTQLLQWVVSNTVDQTGYILQTLIRTAFVGISGKPDFNPIGRSGARLDGVQEVILAQLEYDPFDARRSTEINERLKQLGFCVVLDGVTFNSRRFNAQEYCQAPGRGDYQSAVLRSYAQEIDRPPPAVRGIAYRPRAKRIQMAEAPGD
jgi:hypothetical protein